MTEKPTRKLDKPAPERLSIASAVEWAKQHPSIIIALLAGLGLTSGDVIGQVNAVLNMDLPGYVVLAMATGYVLLRIVQDARNTQRDNAVTLKSMAMDISEMRAQQTVDADRLEAAEGRLESGRAMFTDHGRRLGRLESIHKAEIAAYDEKQRRDTGTVKP